MAIITVVCILEQSLGETSRPLNRAAAKGVEVQLDCSTQEPENGYWKYTRSSENNERMIYDGRKVVDDMKGLFVVNDSVQGSFNLNFHASESTSGLYTCQPDLNLADQSAEVIVLGKYLGGSIRSLLIDKAHNIQFHSLVCRY